MRKSVRLTVEGTDLLISIFPEDGEVRVSSAEFKLDCRDDGPPRDKGHTLVVTRSGPNLDGKPITRRPTHLVTLSHRITEV